MKLRSFLADRRNMKKIVTLLLFPVILLAAGCFYEAPLADKKDLPLDASLLGSWEEITDAGEKPKIVISKYSETEYAIHFYDTGKIERFLRGYPIVFADIPCIQLITVNEKYMPQSDATAYMVASYEYTEGDLTFKLLIASTNLKSSVELRNDLAKTRDESELFYPKGRFKRVAATESR